MSLGMVIMEGPTGWRFLVSEVPLYSGVTFNVAWPGGKQDAACTLGVMLH